MEIDERKLIEVHLLLDRLFDGEAAEEEALEVQNLIQKSPDLQRYYFRYVEVKAGLHQLKSLDSAYGSSLEKNYDDMFFELAQYEKTAPEMKLPAAPKEPEAAEAPAESRKECFQVSKFSIFFLLLSSAALIFVIVYAHLVSMKQGVETATLTDSLNAQWADENGPLEKGSRLFTSRDGLRLRAGLAELQFDNHTRITIEGPAEFELQAADQLLLRYGRLYASVPPEAIGFRVNTPYARITDLGTEFGVISSPSGDTEVHVFRGQTVLAGDGQKTKKSVLNLTAGSAGIVCDNGATMKTIPHAAHAFIRKIDSRTGLVWKGESAILLTNLLAGHIFTAESDGIEIDPAAGKYVAHENYVAGTERQGGFSYQKINSPFADGCFVPQGRQPQNISSTGLSYEFPKTSGLFHYNLSDRKTAYDTKTSSNYPLHLEPSSSEKPSLFLHPNMGITFDLNKIRRQIPTLEIQRFTAECGIAVSVREALKKMYPDGNIPSEETPSADLLILVDGKVRQMLTGINLASGILKIDVEIQPADRFLTLASTDSNQSFRYDWLVLVQPELKITPAEAARVENKN